MADRIVGVIREGHAEDDENFRQLIKEVACTHDTFMCSVSSLSEHISTLLEIYLSYLSSYVVSSLLYLLSE